MQTVGLAALVTCPSLGLCLVSSPHFGTPRNSRASRKLASRYRDHPMAGTATPIHLCKITWSYPKDWFNFSHPPCKLSLRKVRRKHYLRWKGFPCAGHSRQGPSRKRLGSSSQHDSSSVVPSLSTTLMTKGPKCMRTMIDEFFHLSIRLTFCIICAYCSPFPSPSHFDACRTTDCTFVAITVT